MNIWNKIKLFIFYGLGGASQSLSGILIIPILTKNLTIEEFGAFSMLTLCGSLAGSVFYLGISSALPRFYFDTDSNVSRYHVLSTATILVTLGAVFQIVFGVLFSSKLSILLFHSDHYAVALIFVFAGYALLFLNQFIIVYWRLIGAAHRVLSWALINIALNFAGIIIGLKYVEKSILVPVLVFLISQLIQLAISLIQSREILGKNLNTLTAKAMIRFGVAAVVIAMGTLAIDWFDRFVVNNQLTLKDVAIYSFAYKLGTLINIVFVVPFISVWNPLMLERQSSPDVKKIFSLAVDIYLSIGVCCTVFATLFFKDIVFLFVPKKDYSDIVLYFPFLMLGTLIYGLSNIFSAGFIYSKKLKGLTLIYLFFAIINMGITLIFVKKWGLSGAVASSFVTYLVFPFVVFSWGKAYFVFDYRKIKTFFLITSCLAIIIFNVNLLSISSLSSFFLKLAFFIFYVFVVLSWSLNSYDKKLKDFFEQHVKVRF